MKKAVAAVFAFLLAIFMFAGCSSPKINIDIPDGKLHLYYLPVGDADACVAVSPEGKIMLIDTGLPETYNMLSGFLGEIGAKRIDIVVLTHFHKDHIGGMESLISDYEIGAIYMPDTGHDSDEYNALMDAMNARSLRALTAAAGVSFNFGTVEAEFLTPLDEGDYTGQNELSAVLRLKYDKRTYLLMGDAVKDTEEHMVQVYGDTLDCDVLKCGHHGEGDASKKAFLECVRPEYAVISAGAQEDHATEKVIARLRKAGAEVYVTRDQGMIKVTQDGSNIKIETDR